MKSQIFMVVVLSLVTTIFATPVNSKNAATYLDSDTVAVQKNIETARAEGKNLLVISSASWCPACGEIAEGLIENPDLVSEIKKTHKIIDIEEMNVNQGLQHYFPIRQFFYPLILVYNTQRNAWTFINGDFNFSNRRLLINALMSQMTDAANGVDLLQKYFNIFQSNVANNVAFDDSESGAVASYNFQELCMRIMIDGEKSVGFDLLKSVLASVRAKPELFPHLGEVGFDWNHYVLANSVFQYIAKGELSYDEAISLFPGYAVGTGSSTEEFPAFNAKLMPALYNLETQSGLAAAAQVCESETTAFFGALPVETPKYQIAKFKLFSFCQLLKVQSGLSSPTDYALWTESNLATLTEKEMESVRDMSVDRLVTVNEFAFANKSIDIFVSKESAKYAKNLASAQAELKEAIAADDREAIASITADIDNLGIVHNRNVATFGHQKSSWAGLQKVSSVNEDY